MKQVLLDAYDLVYTFVVSDFVLVRKYAYGQPKGGYTISESCDCMSKVRFGHCKHERMLAMQQLGGWVTPEWVREEIEYLQHKANLEHLWRHGEEVNCVCLPVDVDESWALIVAVTDTVIYFPNKKYYNEAATHVEKMQCSKNGQAGIRSTRSE